MTFFDRVAGINEDYSRQWPEGKGWRVPVWPLRTDIPRVLNQETGFGLAELAAKYNCTVEEMTELAEYVTRAGEMITEQVTALMADGLSQANAVNLAKASVDSIVSHALLRVEQGTMNVAELRAYLGME